MKKPNTLRKKLASHKKELSENYGLIEMGIFGSYAKGKQKKKSDVDILVEFKKTPGLLKFLEIELFLEKMLGTKVDLFTIKSLRPEFRNSILKEVVYV